MEILFPRTFRISFSGRESRSCPSNVMEPFRTFAGGSGRIPHSRQPSLPQADQCAHAPPCDFGLYSVRHLRIGLPHRRDPAGKRPDHRPEPVHLLHRLHQGLPGGCPWIRRTALCHRQQTLRPQVCPAPSAGIFPVITAPFSDTLLQKRRVSGAFLL